MKLEEFKNLIKSTIDEMTTSSATGPFAIPSKSYLKQNKKDKLKETIREMVRKKMIKEDEKEDVYDLSDVPPAEQEMKKKEIIQKNPAKKIIFKTR